MSEYTGQVDNAKLQAIVERIDRPGKEYLSKYPRPEEMFKFLFRPLRTRRLRKKFLKNPSKYMRHYVIKPVWEEFDWKRWGRLGEAIGEHMFEVMGRESFMSKVLIRKPIDQDVLIAGGT